MHCKDAMPKKFETKIFLGKELRGYTYNSYIHASASNFYISLIGLPILLQENRWDERRKHIQYRSLIDTWCGNWDRGRAIPFLVIHKSKFLCSVPGYFFSFLSHVVLLMYKMHKTNVDLHSPVCTFRYMPAINIKPWSKAAWILGKCHGVLYCTMYRCKI